MHNQDQNSGYIVLARVKNAPWQEAISFGKLQGLLRSTQNDSQQTTADWAQEAVFFHEVL